MDEKDAKRDLTFHSPGDELESQIHTFPIFSMLFCDLFSDKRLGRLPGRFFIDFAWFLSSFFDYVFECFSGLVHKWKCHSDSLFTMYEAHARYRK